MNSSLSEVAAALVFTLAGCASNELPADAPRPSDDVSGERAEPVDRSAK